MGGKGGYAGAIPFYQRAIRLDPNFAMAYASLATSYNNLNEPSLAAENTRKAYELRDHVSDREKFYIDTKYSVHVTGDLEKARQSYELWQQTYPRDEIPANNLGVIYTRLGQNDKALAEAQESLRQNPDGLAYANVVGYLATLDRLPEALAVAKEALAKNMDSPYLRTSLYQIAFLQGDTEEMARQVAWGAGKSGVEDEFLGNEADTAGYYGRLAKAREFTRQAVASAIQADEQETAAGYEADAAVREALFGNSAEARQAAAAALALPNGRDVQFGSALALAIAGDSSRAQSLADDLAKRFPEDTIVQFNYLPVLSAQLSLSRNDSSKAIAALQPAEPFELGSVGPGTLYPAYVRGHAFLAAHRGADAVGEFQKILGHRGIVANDPIGALAHLGLARAYALQAATVSSAEASSARAKARAAYNDFLTLWKDADTDIPILREAKAEFTKLE